MTQEIIIKATRASSGLGPEVTIGFSALKARQNVKALKVGKSSKCLFTGECRSPTSSEGQRTTRRRLYRIGTADHAIVGDYTVLLSSADQQDETATTASIRGKTAALAELVISQFHHTFAVNWRWNRLILRWPAFRAGGRGQSTGHVNPKSGNEPRALHRKQASPIMFSPGCTCCACVSRLASATKETPESISHRALGEAAELQAASR